MSSAVITILIPTLWMIVIELNNKDGNELNYLKEILMNDDVKKILYKFSTTTIKKQIEYIFVEMDKKFGIKIELNTENNKKELNENQQKRIGNIMEKFKNKQKKFFEIHNDEIKETNIIKKQQSCLICKGYDNENDNENGNLILPVTIIPTTSLDNDTLIFKRKSKDESKEIICKRKHIITCGHIMHQKCLNKSAEGYYLQHVLMQTVSSADGKRREYKCASCRELYNLCLIIPNECDDILPPFKNQNLIYFKKNQFANYTSTAKFTLFCDKEDKSILPTIKCCSTSATPLCSEKEEFPNFEMMLILLSTTIINAKFSLDKGNENINAFVIKCLILNCQVYYFYLLEFFTIISN